MIGGFGIATPVGDFLRVPALPESQEEEDLGASSDEDKRKKTKEDLEDTSTTFRATARDRRGGPGDTRGSARSFRRGSLLGAPIKNAMDGISQGNQPIGVIHDIMHRTYVLTLKSARHSKDEGTKELIKVLKGEGDEVPVGFEHARATIVREELADSLMRELTRELKAKGESNGGWAKTPKKQVYARVTQIVKMKREVCLLKNEVHNDIMMFNLLNAKVPAQTLESALERRNRVEEFWVHFRTRPRFESFNVVGRKPLALDNKKPKKKFARLPEFDSSRTVKQGGNWMLSQLGPQQLQDAGSSLGFQMLGKSKSAPSLPPVPVNQRPPKPPQENKMGKKTISLPSLTGEKGSTAIGAARDLSCLRDLRIKVKQQDNNNNNRPRIQQKDLELPPLGAPDGSRHRYLKECDKRAIIPTPLPFVTGHSQFLDAAGKDLNDNDLQAIAAMLPESEGVARADLTGNSLLTDKAMAPFLRRLSREPTATTLKLLSLDSCRKASLTTLNETVQLIQVAENLSILHLGRINIGTRFQLPVCTAIGKHPTLTEVSLADTGLGATPSARNCCSMLLSSGTIQTLDLGWNCFRSDVFNYLGECCAQNKVLRTLCVANCSAVESHNECVLSNDNIPPAALFVENLSRNRTMTKLDVSLNRIDFRTALVLEDALQDHIKLTRLTISQNALGTLGMRSIIRLIARDSAGLDDVETDGCFTGSEPATGEPTFSNANPGGKYVLQLHKPYHRAILRMLYKTCERFKLVPDQAFQSVSYSKGAYTHARQDSYGHFDVPSDGILTISFSIEKAIESALKGVHAEDSVGFLSEYYALTRLTPSFRKSVFIFSNWCRLDGKTLEQRCFVTALSKDFNLKLAHLEFMVATSAAFASETIFRLLPAIDLEDMAMSRYLTFLMFPRLGELLFMHKRMLTQLDFNLENPTGQYKLELSQCSDYAVASQLLLLDAWEAAADRRRGRPDTSQRGNRSHVRNETYQGRPLSAMYQSVQEWTLPEYALFELDYVSGKRPPPDCKTVLSADTFEDFLILLYDSACQPEQKIATLRQVSHHFFITSKQMRTLLGNFPSEDQRGEAFVIFYTRIVDIYNAKLYKVRFDTENEVTTLQNRLGYATFFPFVQPENNKFSLNLSAYDQRLCASILVRLANMEQPINITNPVYTRGDGVIDPLPLGVPRSWEKFESAPSTGTFSCSYVCAPEFRKYEVRRKLAEQYSAFTIKAKEEEVSWWTGLNEPPADVLDLLEFLINAGYKNSEQAFLKIDGVDGNGVITFAEFKEFFEVTNCQKFKGGAVPEMERINGVFRYLDPGGEGSVSKDEWGIIGQLWNEFELSVSEFVEFMCRIFEHDLDIAWDYLDDDGSGELDEKEWCDAVIKMGYFGPSKVVFGLLDNTDDGNISKEEFDYLKQYMPVKKKRRMSCTR